MTSAFQFETTPFYFLRHGETPESRAGILQGQSESVLTALGRKTAEGAAELLAEKPLGAIYASPLKRAWATATIVSVITGAPKFALPGLMERYWGTYQGKPKTERPREENPESAETLDAFTARILEAMRSISGPAPVLVVSHSGVFRVLCHQWGLHMDRSISIDSADLVLVEPPAGQRSHWHLSAVTS